VKLTYGCMVGRWVGLPIAAGLIIIYAGVQIYIGS
jgi:hypothetical protein